MYCQGQKCVLSSLQQTLCSIPSPLPALVLSWLLAVLMDRMSSFIYSYSYLKTEFSIGKCVRTLLSDKRQGLWSGVLQKEIKYMCLEGWVEGDDGKVM